LAQCLAKKVISIYFHQLTATPTLSTSLPHENIINTGIVSL